MAHETLSKKLHSQNTQRTQREEEEKNMVHESDNGRLETPNILKSANNAPQEPKEEDREMYTQTRFFDPEILSFRPLKYPNISFLHQQGAKSGNKATTHNTLSFGAYPKADGGPSG
mmetsp:Transcript_24009/g.36905  ORF Transcript_24009/g.36905 Transcript_24009/m.36905 type:complete len:116 (-) Transcript_24009:3185-3532(-)|eukprot:CAMPEP_0170497052 /NCGR_PEP_ID=MMETSP0208-20121228/23559_1 /TAXON_ID=197538 /ORGANISM="Strombidium inclinatum, Strain S3" /LENGTH=115 /DNA_ID=CAMNT_0010773743 /DNA_START=405 /DNA_END=752 /DNA_ORIENTATION=-